MNGNGGYDPPPADHAWRLPVSSASENATLTFSHNTDFTDVAFLLLGDVNGDSKVNFFDLLGILKVLGGTETNPDYITRADVTQDGKANIFDLLELLRIIGG